jgi:hypothetical protein
VRTIVSRWFITSDLTEVRASKVVSAAKAHVIPQQARGLIELDRAGIGLMIRSAYDYSNGSQRAGASDSKPGAIGPDATLR